MCRVNAASGKVPPVSSGWFGFGGSIKVVHADKQKSASSSADTTSTMTPSALFFRGRNKDEDTDKKRSSNISAKSASPSSFSSSPSSSSIVPSSSTNDTDKCLNLVGSSSFASTFYSSPSSTPTPSQESHRGGADSRSSYGSHIFEGGWSPSWSWAGQLMDEWQYRVRSLDSYRKVVRGRMDATLEGFQARYEAASRDLRKDVDKQLAKASALHEDYMDKINQQQQRLAELTRSELRIRQQGFNTSLETFKRQYDDTWGRFSGTVRKLGPFTKTEVADQQRRLDEAFQQFMTQYSNSTAEVRCYIDRMMKLSGDVFPRLSLEDEHVLGRIRRLREEEMAELARLGKKQLRSERARLEGVVERLREQQERMTRQWTAQKGELDLSLKRLLEQLLRFNRLYDDLIARKESNLYADSLNDKVLRRALECLDQGEADGWEFVTETNGVRVHRKSLPSMDGKLSKYCCVKATGILAASPADILTLFEDNTRVAEYNKFYAEGRDLEAINDCTKVVWAASPPMFFFKARDFCTVVHYRKLQDGTVVVVNRAVEHPDAPRTDKYVRAEILMGANIIQPVVGKPHQALFTIVTQVDPGIKFAPPSIVNKVVSWGPPTFFKEIETAAQKVYSSVPSAVTAAAVVDLPGKGAVPAQTLPPSPSKPASGVSAPSPIPAAVPVAATSSARPSRPPPLLPSERTGKNRWN